MLLLVTSLQAVGAPRIVTGDGLEPLPSGTRPLHYRISVTPDAAAGRFEANAELEFEVIEPTARVTVNAIDIDIATARLDGGIAAEVVKDDARQRVDFVLPRPLGRGVHRMSVGYSGRIGETVEGVFKVRYPARQGAQGEMLFTHLCCIATARRFAPLWDQPDMKAVFELELIIPSRFDAVSNMPIARREKLPDGRARVRFAPSPRMSSYLLFFAVGEFDRISRRAGPTELSVVLERGKAEQGRFALDATAEVITAYNEYFGMPYPLPKLDSVGMPGAGGFGAMENWGAIFYFEPYIAVNPALTTERDRQIIFEIIAHEVAHQWFGNLVTMRWWDDLWLNEGFASWMASRTSDRLRPQWRMWLHAANNRERAIQLDASTVTHPIIRDVKTLEEAQLAFDHITYEKGNQVIRMVEGWVGEQAFRSAIREYVRKHAYGNAVTADLVAELDRASALPVTDIVRDFTRQGGVPMIEVLSTKCTAGSDVTRVTVRQRRFGLDAESQQPRLWHVPVTASVVGSSEVARQVIRGAQPVHVQVPGCGPVKINVGESGYYRTLYDAASLAGLISAFSRLPVTDQFGLLKDNRGLAEGDYGSFETYLDMADDLPSTADPLLINDYVEFVGELDRLYVGMPSREAFRAFVRSRFSTVLNRVGWEARAGEPANTEMLRGSLIGLLAQVDDKATIAEAVRRHAAADRDAASLSGSIRKAVIAAVGSGADLAVYGDFVARAARASDSAEQRLYLLALAGANDLAIARRTMVLALSSAVPKPLFPSMFRLIAERHGDAALDFVVEHYDEIAAATGAYAPMYIASLIRNASSQASAEKFLAFASGRLSKQSLERAQAATSHRQRLRHRGLAQVDAWLARHNQAE